MVGGSARTLRATRSAELSIVSSGGVRVRRCAIAAIIVGLLVLGGCAPVSSSPVAQAEPTATHSPTAEPAHLSAAAVQRARDLHGVSHEGETLYLVVITSDASESVLSSRQDEATPYFGDAADYFVVLESAWFPELQPVGFVLAEAHASADKAEEARAWWADRVDASWYKAVVRKVTVETTSPIPVVYVDVD